MRDRLDMGQTENRKFLAVGSDCLMFSTVVDSLWASHMVPWVKWGSVMGVPCCYFLVAQVIPAQMLRTVVGVLMPYLFATATEDITPLSFRIASM
jgi:hypothetical protein